MPSDSKSDPKMVTTSDVEILPVLPLRNAVLYPAQPVPINVGRPRSVRLIEELFGRERAHVALCTQKKADVEEPSFKDLHEVGVIARIVRVVRMSSGSYSVTLQGTARMRILEPIAHEPFMRARIQRLHDVVERDIELDALSTTLRESTREIMELDQRIPREVAGILDNVREPGALADLIAGGFPLEIASLDDKQTVLQTFDVKARVKFVLQMVARQLEMIRVKKEIQSTVQEELGKVQREQILRQQLKVIRDELGEGNEEDELEELRDRIARAHLPPDVDKIAKKQLSRLANIPPQSAEYGVTRNYLDWFADLPWHARTEDRLDVAEVRRVLDEDHFGLEKIKKRIVEYIAVRKLAPNKKGPILCLIGPPGVGKTSLGKSIARATGHKLHRISLGGVRDEAEVRGHRRTYVGALPGRIIQAMRKVKVINPILQLDEVDKLGADNRGDPSAALLELLDPEQNDTFTDHYLDVPFDLSKVMFLATANTRDTIPGPLLDRMEVIDIAGYTRTEKLRIAIDYLIPKLLESHGISPDALDFTKEGVGAIVDSYTREPGVRGLERELANIVRWGAMKLASGETLAAKIDPTLVRTILGAEKHVPDIAERRPTVGLVAGLAWTPAGGDLLFIECGTMPGSGTFLLTGNLRNVMQESAHAALSYVRSHLEDLHIDPEAFKKLDVHVHVPHGGTPKDGPSAGVTMFTAIVSRLTGCPVRSDIAMTGEITLRGLVLPIGGVKEKILAAHRGGIKKVILPERNRRNLDDVPKEIRDEMELVFVKKANEVLVHALLPPTPAPAWSVPPPAGDDGDGDEARTG
ncbi:MAG: endopeptidase La [Polyangiales bacterium]